MLLAITDTETTGTSPDENRITDIGIVLFSTDAKRIIDTFSMSINEPDHGLINDYITELNGTTSDFLNDFGTHPEDERVHLFEHIQYLFDRADYCVAHNAQFDRGMLEGFYKRYNRKMPEKDWICSQRDIKYPRTCKYENLTYLSGFYNIINPMQHRAIGDAFVTTEIIKRHNIDSIIKRYKSRMNGTIDADKVKVIVKLEFDQKEEREVVKSYQFKWDRENKLWWKMIIKEDIQTLPFKVELL